MPIRAVRFPVSASSLALVVIWRAPVAANGWPKAME
jgi:hypothetical protein